MFVIPSRRSPIRFILATAACALLLVVSPAWSATARQLHAREHRQVLSLHRYRGTVMFFARHPRQARSRIGRREARRAWVWVLVIRAELAQTRSSLRPRPLFLGWWLAQATCIHQHEGAWNSNTGNGYFGGMQFLPSTYRSVGGRADGRADLDSPQEQLHRAWLVWRRDGGRWSEWGTAGACGV